MNKVKTVFECHNCGHQSPKWMGKCPDCETWNSMVEGTKIKESKSVKHGWVPTSSADPTPITKVTASNEQRVSCRIGELDRVLGGGVVESSFVMIGGEPGAGKSTLILQAAHKLSEKGPVLYCSGEESAAQIKARGERLNACSDNLYLLAENSLETIMSKVERLKPKYLVVDSIQTIFTSILDSAPGSVSQVKECAGRLMQFAKSGTPTFLIGHVTKDGSLAGPRMLEHMVDTVLYFEGNSGHAFRILRAVKNRFGSTNEIGVFEMKGVGLVEVPNPSEMFLSERPENSAGSVVVPSIEGTRPILVEVQSLVSTSSYGTPRRTCMGFDGNRTALLCAVLEKQLGYNLSGMDVYLNVAGGVRLNEPAADLGVMASLISSHMNRPVEQKIIIIGEVGLGGEIRAVANAEPRIVEAYRMGFTEAILPAGNMKNISSPKGMKLSPVRTAAEAMEKVFQ